jgi:hypothetical protein
MGVQTPNGSSNTEWEFKHRMGVQTPNGSSNTE